MAFDYKKEYKKFYLPKKKPELVEVPAMNYIAVRGTGNPNQEDGDYKKSIGLLYAIAFTIKMSRRSGHQIDGYFDYVVPPLEGFWWQEGTDAINYADKSGFCWISVLRLPDFITPADFEWAVKTASRKKKLDCSAAEFLTIEEGLCVQILHPGSYDDEPKTVAKMDRFLAEQGYQNDMDGPRRHHEIYLSDPRRTAPEKCKTVIRHPIRKAQ